MRCERCGEGEIRDERLPDFMCWDGRASSGEVADWIQLALEDLYGPARRLLGQVGDERAADGLRRGLETAHPWVLESVVSGLGWSGDASDRDRLRLLLGHNDRQVRQSVRASLTELEVPRLGELLLPLLEDVDPQGQEAVQILECLGWVDDPRVLPYLRQLLAQAGARDLGALTGSLASALSRLGTSDDRRAMADIIVSALRASVGGTQAQMWSAVQAWNAFVNAVQPNAETELGEIKAGLSGLPEQLRDAMRLDRTGGPLPLRRALGARVVPRRSMTRISEEPPNEIREPAAKFGGQPDWRDTPAWPVGGDGRLLMFYGQLPLPDDVERTAYIFLAGPEEWQPLSGGNAVVVQPGNRCHLPTRPHAVGPQLYQWQADAGRFRHRSRRVRAPDRFITLTDGADPTSWRWPENPPRLERDDDRDWDKIGGTPLWLQRPEQPPADGWTYAFQFNADLVAERGDGAVCYGWTDGQGQAAFGWQCH